MDLTIFFTIYLIIFRLAIISAAIICIILGYKLFIKGVWPETSYKSDTSVRAEFAGTRFTLKNAAPGTCFALFGIIVISVMLVTGGPFLTLKNLKNSGQFEKTANGKDTITELYLRKTELNKINQINSDYENGYINAEKAYKQLYEYLSLNSEKRE